MGIISVVLCIETGGLASAFYMLVFLTLRLRRARHAADEGLPPHGGALRLLLPADLVFPIDGGILAGQFDLILNKFQGGVVMDAELINSLVVHCAFLFAGTWIAIGSPPASARRWAGSRCTPRAIR